jgi:hypothetical protein
MKQSICLCCLIDKKKGPSCHVRAWLQYILFRHLVICAQDVITAMYKHDLHVISMSPLRFSRQDMECPNILLVRYSFVLIETAGK